MSRIDGEEMRAEAHEVLPGDYLPGLDNGYVFEVEETEVSISTLGDRFPHAKESVLITFHDADGEECYLILPRESRLTIIRP